MAKLPGQDNNTQQQAQSYQLARGLPPIPTKMPSKQPPRLGSLGPLAPQQKPQREQQMGQREQQALLASGPSSVQALLAGQQQQQPQQPQGVPSAYSAYARGGVQPQTTGAAGRMQQPLPEMPGAIPPRAGGFDPAPTPPPEPPPGIQPAFDPRRSAEMAMRVAPEGTAAAAALGGEWAEPAPTSYAVQRSGGVPLDADDPRRDYIEPPHWKKGLGASGPGSEDDPTKPGPVEGYERVDTMPGGDDPGDPYAGADTNNDGTVDADEIIAWLQQEAMSADSLISDEDLKEQQDALEKQYGVAKAKAMQQVSRQYGARGLGASGMAASGIAQVDAQLDADLANAQTQLWLDAKKANWGKQSQLLQSAMQAAINDKNIEAQKAISDMMFDHETKQQITEMLLSSPEKILAYVGIDELNDEAASAMMEQMGDCFNSPDPHACLFGVLAQIKGVQATSVGFMEPPQFKSKGGETVVWNAEKGTWVVFDPEGYNPDPQSPPGEALPKDQWTDKMKDWMEKQGKGGVEEDEEGEGEDDDEGASKPGGSSEKPKKKKKKKGKKY